MASSSDVMKSGDTVILYHKASTHIEESKFVFLRPGEKIKIARASVKHEDLIGFPFGSVFEVNKGDRSAVCVFEQNSHEQLLEEILASGNPGSNINEVSKDRDNRVLVDKNALTNGKESSQKLGADQIKELKNSGMNGREVIKSLIENSDTFKHKTEFSQAKWLKKKAAKHSPQFVTIRPTSLTLCQAYFKKCAGKINYMREDTLGRMLTMSNVQAGSRALVVDSGCGLVLGAVAERIGGYGRILHGFNGLQPSVDALRWMNLDKEAIASVVQFPLSELKFCGRMQHGLQELERRRASKKGRDGKGDGNAGGQTEDNNAGDLSGSSALLQCCMAAMTDGKEEQGEMEKRQRRVDGGYRAGMSFRNEEVRVLLEGQDEEGETNAEQEVPHTKLSVSQIQEELERGFDSLVIAGSLDVNLLVPPLMHLLQPSSPIVVYSPTPQPLLELEEFLIQNEFALNLHITESWMREYQVLPNRTHPLMQMSGGSGFLLTGIRVNKSARPQEKEGGAMVDAAVKDEAMVEEKMEGEEKEEEEDKEGPAEKKQKI